MNSQYHSHKYLGWVLWTAHFSWTELKSMLFRFQSRNEICQSVKTIVSLRRKINTKTVCAHNTKTNIQSLRNSKSDWFEQFDTSYISALQTLNTPMRLCRCSLVHTVCTHTSLSSAKSSPNHANGEKRIRSTQRQTDRERARQLKRKRGNQKCIRAITRRRIFLVRHTLINGDYDRTKMTLLWMRGQFPCMNAVHCA